MHCDSLSTKAGYEYCDSSQNKGPPKQVSPFQRINPFQANLHSYEHSIGLKDSISWGIQPDNRSDRSTRSPKASVRPDGLSMEGNDVGNVPAFYTPHWLT